MSTARTIRPLLAATMLLGLLPAAAHAQEAPAAAPAANAEQPAQPRVNWVSNCNAPSRLVPLSCSMDQRVLLRDTGQQLGRAAIQTSGPEPRTAGLLLHLPLGLAIEAGVSVVVDADTPVKLAVQTCDASGCYAASQLQGELLTAMQRGRELKVTFEDLQRKPITVSFTLEGFTDAYNGIK
ncbi:MAG: invasion associated locus B family protein [Aestuariivirga sp.]|uniref:invasion associated locus B family protein n=1 Tax=Aestuariivirga sp. TaxID=2650926 RepID=UPI0038D074B0